MTNMTSMTSMTVLNPATACAQMGLTVSPLQPTGVCARLRQAYLGARGDGMTRHRDIAVHLGVSEGELIAAHVAGTADAGSDGPAAAAGHRQLRARRLRNDWPALLAALEHAGELMALTRNASCVHEKTGVYRNTSAHGPAGREMGMVLGPEIDLRVFYSRWAHAFVVEEISDTPGLPSVQRSLQFFDETGVAVHKVFTRPRSDLDAWLSIANTSVSDDQIEGLTPQPTPAGPAAKADADVDLQAFHDAWASMRDTHEFFGLLRQHGVSRTQAMRLAEPRFVRQVDASSAHQVLAAAAASGTPVMVFVGNPGMIQIHTGPIQKVVVIGPWLNVLDNTFNLHLREDHINSAWVVRKPTVDGLVTSLELFDAHGDTIAMLFGERKPGRAELCAWRELVDQLVGDATGTGGAACQP
jgi:putative hemin transport protein